MKHYILYGELKADTAKLQDAFRKAETIDADVSVTASLSGKIYEDFPIEILTGDILDTQNLTESK